jgi:hypothetical protein
MRRQEGTAGGGCRDLSTEFSTTELPETPSPASQDLCPIYFSICNLPSNLMTATHVYVPMDMATLTVIPYTLKLQKPFNRNVHNPVSKPLVNQPNPLNVF